MRLLITLAWLSCLPLAWFVLSPWLGNETARLDRLQAIAYAEGAQRLPPSAWLEQWHWLTQHRLAQLGRWWTSLGCALVMGAVEGWHWRRQQYFRGYHRILWLSACLLAGTTIVLCVLFLVWLQVVPMRWGVSGLSLLALLWSFATVAGFPLVK